MLGREAVMPLSSELIAGQKIKANAWPKT